MNFSAAEVNTACLFCFFLTSHVTLVIILSATMNYEKKLTSRCPETSFVAYTYSALSGRSFNFFTLPLQDLSMLRSALIHLSCIHNTKVQCGRLREVHRNIKAGFTFRAFSYEIFANGKNLVFAKNF